MKFPSMRLSFRKSSKLTKSDLLLKKEKEELEKKGGGGDDDEEPKGKEESLLLVSHEVESEKEATERGKDTTTTSIEPHDKRKRFSVSSFRSFSSSVSMNSSNSSSTTKTGSNRTNGASFNASHYSSSTLSPSSSSSSSCYSPSSFCVESSIGQYCIEGTAHMCEDAVLYCQDLAGLGSEANSGLEEDDDDDDGEEVVEGKKEEEAKEEEKEEAHDEGIDKSRENGDNTESHAHYSSCSSRENTVSLAEVEKVAYLGCFDGHGGEGCSDFLSRNLHHKIIGNDKFTAFEEADQALRTAFAEAEREFLAGQDSHDNPGIPGNHENPGNQENHRQDTSGSCATVAIIKGQQGFVASVGDCRAVLWTGYKQIQQITSDHRGDLPEEHARIVKAGGFVRHGRVLGVLAPSRSFGDIDIKTDRPGAVVAEPDVFSFDVTVCKQTGFSFLILATDGVWDCLSNEKACRIVLNALKKTDCNVNAAAKSLAEHASERNSDDVSVIVYCWKQQQKPFHSQSRAS